MGDFLDRIDDFSFELLGLILPALLFVLMLFQPFIYGDFCKNELIDNIDSIYDFFSKFGGIWIIIVVIFVFYAFGNVIKVASKIYYELGEALFDNTILKIFKFLYSQIIKLLLKITKDNFDEKHIRESMKNMPFVSILNVIHRWVKKLLSFKCNSYGSGFKDVYIDLAKNEMQINNFNYDFPEKSWYTFYKMATNILDNNNIKNMYRKFLAKYTSFRSIEFVFVFGIIYNAVLYTRLVYVDITLYNIVFCFNVFCMISFHEKFKRYWMLCGNEVITGLKTYCSERKNRDEK